MPDQFRFAPLSVVGVVFALSVADSAAPAIAETLQVPPVLVSATRSEQSLLSSPAAIVTVSREAIAASGATELADVLRNIGAIQVADLYGDGRRASFSMRGFSAETANANVLVLVDGRRLNNTDIRNPDLSSVLLADIERIEIVQGSAGTLYGDQAVGGVINVITRRPGEPAGYARVETGSYDRKGLSAGYEQRLDSGLGYRFAALARDSDNYRDRNAAEHRNLSARLDYGYATGLVFAEYQYVDDRLQTPGSLFADEVAVDRRQSVDAYQGDFSDTLTRAARVGINQSLSQHWSLEAEATRRTIDGDFQLSGRFFAGSPNSQDSTLVSLNPRLIGSYPLADGELLLTLGLDRERTEYAIESVFGAQSNEQTTRAIYAQAVIPVLADLQLTLGRRYAELENRSEDPFSQLPPSPAPDLDDSIGVNELGLSWQATAAIRLFGRYDENFRFVKFDEQSSAASVLNTQTGISREIGAEWRGGVASGQIVLYRLDLDNELGFDPTTFANFNLPSTERRGVNVEATMGLGADLQLGVGLGWVDAENVSGQAGERRIPMVAENTARLALDYDASQALRLHGELVHIGNRVLSGDFDNSLERLPAYDLVNASLRWRRGSWDLSARVNNLFDESYSEFGAASAGQAAFLPSPTRNFVVSASARF